MNNGNQMNTNRNSQFSSYNQPMQQNPFGAQGMMQRKVKKPMKIGWIISLIFVVVSSMVILTGVMVSAGGVNMIKQNIKNDSNAHATTNLSLDTYVYKDLTVGGEYAIVLSQNTGPEITSVIVDGITISSSYQETKKMNSNTESFKVYRFTARSNKVEVRVSPIEKKTDVKVSLLEEPKYGSALSQMIMGLIIFVGGILITVFSVIIFIIFLVIFLVKNSKYKQAQRYSSMM